MASLSREQTPVSSHSNVTEMLENSQTTLEESTCVKCNAQFSRKIFFCPKCGTAHLQNMILGKKTTADYDPMRRDYKPWREPPAACAYAPTNIEAEISTHWLTSGLSKPWRLQSQGPSMPPVINERPWRPVMKGGGGAGEKKKTRKKLKKKKEEATDGKMKNDETTDGGGEGGDDAANRGIGSEHNDSEGDGIKKASRNIVYFHGQPFQKREVIKKKKSVVFDENGQEIPQTSPLKSKEQEAEEEAQRRRHTSVEELVVSLAEKVHPLGIYEAHWIFPFVDGYQIYISLLERGHIAKSSPRPNDVVLTEQMLRIGAIYDGDDEYSWDKPKELFVIDVISNEEGRLMTPPQEVWVELDSIDPTEHYMCQYLQRSLIHIAKRVIVDNGELSNIFDERCVIKLTDTPPHSVRQASLVKRMRMLNTASSFKSVPYLSPYDPYVPMYQRHELDAMKLSASNTDIQGRTVDELGLLKNGGKVRLSSNGILLSSSDPSTAIYPLSLSLSPTLNVGPSSLSLEKSIASICCRVPCSTFSSTASTTISSSNNPSPHPSPHPHPSQTTVSQCSVQCRLSVVYYSQSPLGAPLPPILLSQVYSHKQARVSHLCVKVFPIRPPCKHIKPKIVLMDADCVKQLLHIPDIDEELRLGPTRVTAILRQFASLFRFEYSAAGWASQPDRLWRICVCGAINQENVKLINAEEEDKLLVMEEEECERKQQEEEQMRRQKLKEAQGREIRERQEELRIREERKRQAEERRMRMKQERMLKDEEERRHKEMQRKLKAEAERIRRLEEDIKYGIVRASADLSSVNEDNAMDRAIAESSSGTDMETANGDNKIEKGVDVEEENDNDNDNENDNNEEGGYDDMEGGADHEEDYEEYEDEDEDEEDEWESDSLTLKTVIHGIHVLINGQFTSTPSQPHTLVLTLHISETSKYELSTVYQIPYPLLFRVVNDSVLPVLDEEEWMDITKAQLGNLPESPQHLLSLLERGESTTRTTAVTKHAPPPPPPPPGGQLHGGGASKSNIYIGLQRVIMKTVCAGLEIHLSYEHSAFKVVLSTTKILVC